MNSRAIPSRCGKCGHRAMELAAIPYTANIEHEGRTHEIHLATFSVPRCASCGQISIDDEADRRITEAFRHQARLLSPHNIRRGHEERGLTQQEFADLLGVSEAAIARWESGAQLQSRSMDNLLRLFIHSEEVRRLLQQRFQVTPA